MITLPDLNLIDAERRLVVKALELTDTLVAAAQKLGTDRHVLRRLIAKHGIFWWPYAQKQPAWRAGRARNEDDTTHPKGDTTHPKETRSAGRRRKK